MMDERMTTLCARARDAWGDSAQLLMLFEEMGELQAVVCQFYRGRRDKAQIAEEIADVRICLETLRQLADIPEAEIDEFARRKLDRLEGRLGESLDRAGRKTDV